MYLLALVRTEEDTVSVLYVLASEEVLIISIFFLVESRQ
jgi:hypothetical protein